MKRVACIAFALMTLLGSMAVPVSAEENLVDSKLVDWQPLVVDIGSNFNSIPSNLSGTINGFDYTQRLYFSCSGTVPVGATAMFMDLTDTLTVGHGYNLSFICGSDFNYLQHLTFKAALVYTDANNVQHEILLFNSDDLFTSFLKEVVDVNFSLNVDGGVINPLLVFYFVQKINTSSGYRVLFSDIILTDTDDNSGFFENIGDWLSALYHSIVGGVDSSGVNHQSLPQAIGAFINSLGDRIAAFFSSLGDRISGFFDGIWLKIQGAFTKLTNILMYGNAAGTYTNPFGGALSEIEDVVYGLLVRVDGFMENIGESRVNVSGYLNAVTYVFNRYLSAFAPLAALVVFSVAMLVARKVVGR